MSDPIRVAFDWTDNAAMFADLATVDDYIDDDVLDLSYGDNGGFWKRFRPKNLTTNDANPNVDAGHHYDVMEAPPLEWHSRFGTTVWDGPYRFSGTRDRGEFDSRYGLDGGPVSADDTMNILCTGTRYALDVTKVGGTVLVKCQDQVVSGAKRWQRDEIKEAAEAHGARLEDQMIYLGDGIGQPKGSEENPRAVRHLRSNYSWLLIFRKREHVWPTLL